MAVNMKDDVIVDLFGDCCYGTQVLALCQIEYCLNWIVRACGKA